MPDFSFLDTGVWGDAYREAGGVVVPEYLEQLRSQQGDTYGDYEPELPPEPEQSYMDPGQFVDWPTYQGIVSDKLKPHEAYDEYVTVALPTQLRNMGYGEDEIAQAMQQFPGMVAPPAADYGIVGNLWESVKGGFAGGTRAEQAAGNLVTGDLDDIAKLVTDQATGPRPNAPLQRFQQAISTPEAQSGLWDAIKAYAGAAWDEKEGAANFLAEQFAQSYPSLVGAAGGATVGAGVGGPLGAFIGGVAGVGAGSTSVELGSQILERVASAAQARGIDPRDTAAVRAMINDPEVYTELRNAALAKGLTVGAADAAVSAFSFGMGKYATQAARAGNRLRATGLAAGGVGGEALGGAGGEALSQVAAGDEPNYRDIVGEAFGEIVPGGANVAIGALMPSQQQGTPGNTPPLDDITEDDMAGGEQGPLSPIPTLTGGVVPNANPMMAVGPEGGAFVPTPENVAARDRALRGQIGVEELPIGEEITLGGTGMDVTEGGIEEITLGATPEIEPATVEEITLQPAQAVDNAELRIRDGRLLPLLPPGRASPPLLGSPGGIATPAQLEDGRIDWLTTPQAPEIRVADRDVAVREQSMLDWLAFRGVTPRTNEQVDIISTLANVPADRRQETIAAAIEELTSSPARNSEQFALGLLEMSRQIPRDRNTRARAQEALESALPGVPLTEVPKVVASEAAQKVMDDLAAGVLDAPTPTATAAPANPLAARRPRGRPSTALPDNPIQQRRGLGAAEPIPTSGGLGGLVGQLTGAGPAASNEAPVQQPRGSLRNRVNQEGVGGGGRRNTLRGGQGAAAGGDTRGAGAQSLRAAGAGGVSGVAPPIKVQLSTERTPRMYGAQEEDVANTEALSEERFLARAKRQSGGLGKKAAREQKRKVDAVVMDKAEYEKTYPGRNYDDDTNDLLDAGWTTIEGGTTNPNPLSPGLVRQLQMSSFNDVMSYLSAVMPSPLQRLVAQQIERLDLNIPFQVVSIPGNTKGIYRVRNGQGTILIDPRKAEMRTVLHEAVHAATVHAMKSPANEKQARAAALMEGLFQYAKQNIPNADSHYGLTDVYEFVAEAMANPAFQKELQALPVKGSRYDGFRNAWDMFKRLVMRLLGLNTSDNVLSEAILNASDLFSNPTSITSVELADQAPPASNGRSNAPPPSAVLGTKDGVRTFIAYAKSKDANTTYTLYPVTQQEYRGVKGAGIERMTRKQVEQHITGAGSTVVAPATDTSVAKGTPKNSSTKQVGYDSSSGDLKSAAFEQKDGTWTYYESDADVRTDPDARVTKGLSKDAVQRFITARGLATEPPKGGVKPASDTPTSVGYKPAGWLRRFAQDEEGTLLNIGGDVEQAAVMRNSRVARRLREVDRQYVEPLRKAGQQLTERFGKTEDQIFELMQNMHVVERMATKMQQFARGDLSPAEQAVKQQELLDKQTTAQKYVNDARASNPAYVKAVEQELAPKVRALANNTIDMSAQYGFLSRDEAEAIKKAYDFYVPLQKDDKRTTVGKAATGASVTGDLTFPRMVEQAQRTIARGEQNVVRNEVLKLVEQDVLKVKDTGEVPVTVGPRHVIRYNKEKNSLDTGEDNFVFDRDAVDVYRNGERIRMKITDPSLLDALHPYKGEERPVVVTAALGALARVNRIISIGKTSLNPAWPPFNFARDILTSNINLPTGVSRAKYWAELANPKNYASVLWNVAKEAFGGEPAGGYADAKDAGAFISHRAFIGLDPIAAGVQAMFKPPLVSFDKKHLYGLSQQGTKLGQAGARTFEILSIWAQVAESVPRMAMYKAAMSSGMPKDKAAMAAKNASVNFERRGTANLSNYWIFGNAKMQGVHALIKTAQRQGVRTSVLGGAAIVAMGALAASLGYEWSEKDKDGKSKYTKVPDFKKDALLLFTADGYGIPIPQEVAPLYVLGNAVAEATMGGITAGKATARWVTSVMNNGWPGSIAQQDPVGHNANAADFLTRMILPSQLAPLYDTATNRNTFGREVVSGLKNKKEQGIPMSEMGSPNENQLAVNSAKWLYESTDGKVDIAPQQLKLWHNYLDPATEGFAFVRDLFGGRESKYVGDVVNPFKRKFTGMATEFYDQEQFEELLANAKRAKYLAEQPGRGGISALSPDDQVLARSAQMLEKVERDGNNLFKGQKLMTPERRQMLNERKRDLVLGGIRRYNDMRDQTIPKR